MGKYLSETKYKFLPAMGCRYICSTFTPPLEKAKCKETRRIEEMIIQDVVMIRGLENNYTSKQKQKISGIIALEWSFYVSQSFSRNRITAQQ